MASSAASQLRLIRLQRSRILTAGRDGYVCCKLISHKDPYRTAAQLNAC